MVYVISDLHGYPMDKFLRLLKQADFSDDDFLYIIGDVVDRNGDGGVQMLLWLMEFDDITEDSIDSFNSEKIYTLTTYLYNGGNVTMEHLKKLPKEQRLAIVEYLRDCPLYETLSVNDKDYILVHSGFENFSVNRKLSDYTVDELIWTRPELSDRYFNDIMTIFGHTPTMYYGDEYKGKIIKTDTWIDIDVGAGHGRGAVLLRLDDGKEFRLSEER